MVEKRGFVLRQVQTDFVYSNTQTSLENLFIQTNETILRNRAVLSYRSLDELTSNIGNVGVDVNLKTAKSVLKMC